MIEREHEIHSHPNFEEYQEFIASHPNYEGLYYDRNKSGRINWVVAGKSPKGHIRQRWWDDKCRELNVPLRKGCYAHVARLIHPTGLHVCQCFGEARSIFYEYPTKSTALLLNRILGTEIDSDSDSDRVECTIKDIIEGWCDTREKELKLANAFGLPAPDDRKHLVNLVYKHLVAMDSRRFSPGVMSNPPDRYDGFHSYGLCCRTKFDKGRQVENMQTYGQDRRAYEDWSDGDYNLANRLMGEFRKQPPMRCPGCGRIAKMSADHIGPISLGFCHSKNFAPMCGRCNSSKNNRFTKSDVDKLLRIEADGQQVISWHSKYIWDTLKYTIKDDRDAKFASSVMAKCHQNVLNILALIYRKTGPEFLSIYLHPEFSLIDYRFDNVDLMNLDKLEIIATPIDSKNKRNNQERYQRIAFENLDDFLKKKNRKTQFLIDENSAELDEIVECVNACKYDLADKRLKCLIEKVCDSILVKCNLDRANEIEFDTDI